MRKNFLLVFLFLLMVAGCERAASADAVDPVSVEVVQVIPTVTAVPVPVYQLLAGWSDVPVRSGRAASRQLVMSVPDEWVIGDVGGMMQYERERDETSVTVFPQLTIPANETDDEHLHRLGQVMQSSAYDYGMTNASVESVGNNIVYVLEYDVRTAAGSHLTEKVYMEVFMPDGKGVALWFWPRRGMTREAMELFLEIARSVRWAKPLKRGV